MEGNTLLAQLANEAVCTNEEVEVGGMEVKHGTTGDARGVGCHVERNFDGLDGADVGAQHTLMPRVATLDTTCVEEAEAEFVVHGERVLCAQVERSGQCLGGRACSVIVDGEEVLEVVADVVELVFNLVVSRVGAVNVDIILESIECPFAL